MALFFLLYSVMWKKWSHTKLTILLFNVISLTIAFIIIFSRSILVYFIINLFLLIIVLFILFIAYKDSKKSKTANSFILYLFLSIFWILNIADILMPQFLSIYRLVVYLISIILFMLILYKVLKKTGR